MDDNNNKNGTPRNCVIISDLLKAIFVMVSRLLVMAVARPTLYFYSKNPFTGTIIILSLQSYYLSRMPQSPLDKLRNIVSQSISPTIKNITTFV